MIYASAESMSLVWDPEFCTMSESERKKTGNNVGMTWNLPKNIVLSCNGKVVTHDNENASPTLKLDKRTATWAGVYANSNPVQLIPNNHS